MNSTGDIVVNPRLAIIEMNNKLAKSVESSSHVSLVLMLEQVIS